MLPFGANQHCPGCAYAVRMAFGHTAQRRRMGALSGGPRALEGLVLSATGSSLIASVFTAVSKRVVGCSSLRPLYPVSYFLVRHANSDVYFIYQAQFMYPIFRNL